MRWEYKIKQLKYHDMEGWPTRQVMSIDYLNQLGSEGWEMCGMAEHVGKGYRCFFKRPAPEPVEKAPAIEV